MKHLSFSSILFCLLILFQAAPIYAQVLEEEETYEFAEDDDYTPWEQYSKAGFWVVPLATPFQRSPYDDLRYHELDGSGRTGAELAEWAYIHEKGANAGIQTPDGLEVFEGENGNYGLRKHKSTSVLIPPDYRQLEYLKRDILVGWIGDSLDIWTSAGKFLRRIHYGFRGGKPPRFVVNLPLIQRGGNEMPYFGREDGVLGPYTRDQDFLSAKLYKHYENFYPETQFHGLYKVENKAQLTFKGSGTESAAYPDSILRDSLYLMLIEYKGAYQLLANQGRELFRQLPFAFPSKGKTEGTFKGYHLGRVGPLYPGIYYEYAKPILRISKEGIKLVISFSEHKVDSRARHEFRYELSGRKSDYNQHLSLISNQYANAGLTPIYQYKKGETASLINAYGRELIPAGSYKKFLAGRGNSILALNHENEIVFLDRRGRPMEKKTFMQRNRFSYKTGLQYLRAGAMRGGILYRDSLEFTGPFLPEHRLFILNETTVVFVDPNKELSLIYDPVSGEMKDTIRGEISKPNNSDFRFIPIRKGRNKGYLDENFEVLIPTMYQDISLNKNHKNGEIFFNVKENNLYGIINLQNEWVLGPISNGQPRKVWQEYYLQREKGKEYLLNSEWKKIHEKGIDKFPFRWYRIQKEAQYIPFIQNGKYGVLSLSEGIVEAAVYDSLNTNMHYSLQYFSLGKGGEFRLVDNLRGKIYPELYKQIQNVYQFEKDPIKRKQLSKKVKDKYDSFIAMVFKTIDTNYKLLLGSGEIIKLEDLED